MNEKFWLAVAFFSFLILVLKYTKSYIINAIDGKSRSIADEINAARKARESAEKSLNEAKKYLEESKKYADKLIENAKNESAKIIKDTELQIEDEINRKTQAVLDRLKMEEEKVVRDFKIDIVKVAIDEFTNNIIKNDLTADDKKKLYEKAANDIEKTLISN